MESLKKRFTLYPDCYGWVATLQAPIFEICFILEDHVTPRRWCRLSFSLRSLCQIFHDPVSELKSLCIRPIMSNKADKGDRKRRLSNRQWRKNSEIQPSPVKSWTVLLLARIELAFKEHTKALWIRLWTRQWEMRWTLCWFQHCANCVRDILATNSLLES